MQPPISAKYSSGRAFFPVKHDTDLPHFKLLKNKFRKHTLALS